MHRNCIALRKVLHSFWPSSFQLVVVRSYSSFVLILYHGPLVQYELMNSPKILQHARDHSTPHLVVVARVGSLDSCHLAMLSDAGE